MIDTSKQKDEQGEIEGVWVEIRRFHFILFIF